MAVRELLIPICLIAAVEASTASLAQDRPATSILDRSFDLKKAVLSPAPLGPALHFEPVEPAAPATAASDARAEIRPERKAARKTVPHKEAGSKPRQKAAVAARKPHKSPLDSFASDRRRPDPRRQTWPCRGGGICAWTQR